MRKPNPPAANGSDAAAVLQALGHGLAELERRRAAAAAGRARRLLGFVAPDRLTPVPAVAVGEFAAGAPREVPADALYTASTPSGMYDFYTRRAERVLPLSLAEVAPWPGAAARLGLDLPARAAVRLLFRAADSAEPFADRLRLFLADAEGAPADYQALLTRVTAFARWAGDTAPRPLALTDAGVAAAADLLPPLRNGSRARALLAAWFAAPHAFPFVTAAGLPPRPESSRELEIVLFFKGQPPPRLAESGAWRLHCTPLVNVIKHSQNVAVPVTGPDAALVLPANTALYEVDRARWCAEHRAWPECRPWLGLRHGDRRGPAPKQYVVTRDPLSAGEPGGEVLRVGVIDPDLGSDAPAVTHLNLEMALVNRQLPAPLAGTPLVGDAGPACCLVGEPSPCLSPPAVGENDVTAEAALAHLLRREGDVTDTLRAALERCACLDWGHDGPRDRDGALRQIEGVRRAVARPGPEVAGTPGLVVEVDLDEASYPNSAPYLFASVLERFWACAAGPLSYARMTARTGREVFTWPPRTGDSLPPSPG